MDVVPGLISLFGYIDPGTGSLLFQVLAATLISAGLFFKGLREKVAYLFTSMFRAKRSTGPVSEAGEHEAIAGQVKPAEPKRKAA